MLGKHSPESKLLRHAAHACLYRVSKNVKKIKKASLLVDLGCDGYFEDPCGLENMTNWQDLLSHQLCYSQGWPDLNQAIKVTKSDFFAFLIF